MSDKSIVLLGMFLGLSLVAGIGIAFGATTLEAVVTNTVAVMFAMFVMVLMVFVAIASLILKNLLSVVAAVIIYLFIKGRL